MAVEDGSRSHGDTVRCVPGSQPSDELDGPGDGERDLQGAEPALDRRVRDAFRAVRVGQPDDEHSARLVDRAQGRELGEHRFPLWSRA